jgi:hypothetical protein
MCYLSNIPSLVIKGLLLNNVTQIGEVKGFPWCYTVALGLELKGVTQGREGLCDLLMARMVEFLIIFLHI